MKYSNEKVENLIKQEKERIENQNKQEKELLDTSKKQMREEHLKSLGLIDENKTSREYIAYYREGLKKEPETGKYYVEVSGALDVTDEEYEEICKYFPPNQPEKGIFKNVAVAGSTFAETTLNIIAIIVLVCGIIGTLICLFMFTTSDYGDFNVIGFISSIGILLTSLTIWAVLRIFCEIAINVRQINNKTK